MYAAVCKGVYVTVCKGVYVTVCKGVYAAVCKGVYVYLCPLVYEMSTYLTNTMSFINNESSQHIPMVQMLHGRYQFGTRTYLKTNKDNYVNH